MQASVIIPAYNAAQTLRACLAALSRQETEFSWEVIVVDDGSRDATPEIAGEAGVRLFRQPNLGPAQARNLGATKARGEVLVFLDADCEPSARWLAEMLRPLLDDPQVSGVQGRYRTRQRQLVARFCQVEIDHRYRIMQSHPSIDFIGTYAAAYRREIFLAAGMFDTSFPMASGEDTDFSYRLASRGHKLVFAPRAEVYHRHPTTWRGYARQKFWRGYWRNRLYRKNKSKMVKDTYTPQSLKLQVGLTYLMALLLLASLMGLSGVWLGLAAAAYLASAAGFLVFCRRGDPPVAWIAPVMVLTRSAALCAGIAQGFAAQIFKP